MTPSHLLELCIDAIDRFNRGEMIAKAPFILLTVPRDKLPTGKTIRLFGRTGPAGDIARVNRKGDRFEVVAYFPAVPIIQALGDIVGAPVKVVRR